MKFSFLKVDKVLYTDDGYIAEVPAGGIQFEDGNKTLILDHPLKLKIDDSGMFKDVLGAVKFGIYKQERIIADYFRGDTLFNVLANENLNKELSNAVLEERVLVNVKAQ